MADEKPGADIAEATSHIMKLLTGGRTPELTPELAAAPGVREIHDYLLGLRRQLGDYARGDFSAEMTMRGTMAGLVKTIQANMKHLIWQMERVQSGALDQRVDYMGEFSQAFNSMVRQLDEALSSLREKEAELLRITNELRGEVEKRGSALSALKKSEENFRFLAEHDPLTGLMNRRSFFAQAEVELSRSVLMETSSCVALMDVDHFKKFNDMHGHLNGDRALSSIARAADGALRAADSMGRYGGEEFVMLFSKSTLKQGLRAAERIRLKVAATPIELLEGGKQHVTVSIGVVEVKPKSEVVDILTTAIAKADKALYEAKAKGRNQVCSFEEIEEKGMA